MAKILYIGNALSSHNKTATTIETLSKLLIDEGHEVIVTSSKNNKALRLWDMVSTLMSHQTALDIVLIDVYSTTGFYFAYILGSLCQLYNLPYCCYLHGGNLPARLDRSPKKCRQLFDNSKFNIAPSHYLLESFRERGYKNLKLIPNNIDISKYDFKSRTEPKPNLLYVRSFHEIYNPTMAIEVLEIVKASYPSASLCMVGPDKDGSMVECKKLAEEKKLDVTFTGLLPKTDWKALSKEYDIFINTTNVDNTPVSVIEAMALGLPVVTTNVGGLPYLLKNEQDALLVEPRNPRAFAAEISRLLENKTLYKSLVNSARNKVEKYDWSHVKTLWNAVIAE
jgi:glycosyltransferase involved in cell wall biosynthesis